MSRRATAWPGPGSHEALPASLASAAALRDLRPLAAALAARAPAPDRLGQPAPRLLLLRRAGEDLQGGLGVVRGRRDLRTPVGHAAGNRARLRDRLGAGSRGGPVARAFTHRLRALRSLHHGDERDA